MKNEGSKRGVTFFKKIILRIAFHFPIKKRTSRHERRVSYNPKKGSRFEEFSMKAFPAIWHQRISRFISLMRLNFALGFVVEANPLFETGFSPGCPFFSFDFSSRSASTMRKRESGNPSRSASALASSALLSICCVHKRRSLSAAASAPGRMDFLSPRNTIVEILGFTRFSL